jgi:hypothetical protein
MQQRASFDRKVVKCVIHSLRNICDLGCNSRDLRTFRTFAQEHQTFFRDTCAAIQANLHHAAGWQLSALKEVNKTSSKAQLKTWPGSSFSALQNMGNNCFH